MTWKPRRPMYDWRSYLTKDERDLVGRLEAQLKALDDALARRSELVAKLYPIRNRAIQRARAEARRKRKG